MTKPKPYLRRRNLEDWLADYGFSASQVDSLIRSGVIPQTHFQTTTHKRLRSKPRAYYNASQVAAALNLTLNP